MGKAENFSMKKKQQGQLRSVQQELARGSWGRIATETIDGLTSYWFDDGWRLIAGSFDDDEFIIRAAPAFSADELHSMPPDAAKEHRIMSFFEGSSLRHPSAFIGRVAAKPRGSERETIHRTPD